MPRKSRRRLPASGCVRGGAGNGDSDNHDFPGRRAAVPDSISADCLRLCLLPALNGEEGSYEYRGLEVPEDAAGNSAETFQGKGITGPGRA